MGEHPPKRPKKVKKWGFVRRKSGSIPEWNFLEINITATWFNSRMEFKNLSAQSQPPPNLNDVVRKRIKNT